MLFRSATTTTNASGDADLTTLLGSPVRLILGKLGNGLVFQGTGLTPLQWRPQEYAVLMGCVNIGGNGYGSVILSRRGLTAYGVNGLPLVSTQLQIQAPTLLDLTTLPAELEADLTSEVMALLPQAPPVSSQYAAGETTTK